MATYTSFAELQNNILQYGDHVIFDYDGFHVEYGVGNRCLTEINGNFLIENNIFKLLDLNAYDFCEQHYNKKAVNWEFWRQKRPMRWPLYADDDFNGMTKCVLELFAKIEKIEELAETSEILFID